MKNKPLAFQIWLSIAAILFVIAILLMVLLLTTLRNFFTDEIYTTIENEQHILTEFRVPGSLERRDFSKDASAPSTERSVQHILLPEDISLYRKQQFVPDSFIKKVYELVNSQHTKTRRYSEDIGNTRVFFVVKKVIVNDQPGYLLSYAFDSYRDTLSFTLFKRLLYGLAIVLILSWIPSLWLARYLSRPLVTLEKHVKQISKQDWHDPVTVDRTDEIGHLGQSIEDMRQKLIHKDETERALMQNISHDLKTPVMVIRGYTQAIKDGIFPQGDLDSTVDVIEAEAEKLEKKIKNLLYLTKLDYLSKQKQVRETFHLSETIQSVVDRLKWSRIDIDWLTSLDDVSIEGDEEQWNKLVENILENQIRYAEQTIEIQVRTGNVNEAILTIKNDGPHIEEKMLTSLFEPFNKGKKGEFGIGLSIVKRILELHNAKIKIENKETGVCYTIIVPKNRL
ncbi:ATP-binding protein [Bacillus gobiensis]|uniref:sensor histidine kinase n=1 Tax=Bacillus gobiensis TaxID=1441095 RepID=UPI003D1D7387